MEDCYLLLGTLVLQQLYQDKGYGVTEFVRSVLDIHSKYENMVNSLFSNHRDFSVALDQVSITLWVTIATYNNADNCRHAERLLTFRKSLVSNRKLHFWLVLAS